MPLEPTDADRKAATDYATSLPSVRSFGVRRQAFLAGKLHEREQMQGLLEDCETFVFSLMCDEETQQAGLWQGPAAGRLRDKLLKALGRGLRS